jgi:hypothetical protein
MIVSPRQLRAFEDVATNRFVSSILAYLAELFPNRLSRNAEPIDREFVLEGITGARAFGLTTGVDVAKFIVVSGWLGGKFVHRLEPPWLAAILAYPHFSTASDRIEAIYRAAPVR